MKIKTDNVDMSLAKPWHNCLAQLFRRRSFQSRSSFTMRLGSETELSLAATDPQISSCASTRIPRCAFLQTTFVSFLYISCQNNALLMHAVRLPVYGGGQGDGADTEDLRLRVPTTAAAGVEQLWQREGDRGHLGQGFPNQGEEVVAWRLEIAVSYFGHFQRSASPLLPDPAANSPHRISQRQVLLRIGHDGRGHLHGSQRGRRQGRLRLLRVVRREEGIQSHERHGKGHPGQRRRKDI